MEDLKVMLSKSRPSRDLDTIQATDFYRLLKIGGHHMKHLRMAIFDDETNLLRVVIDNRPYLVRGDFNLSFFMRRLVQNCSKIESLSCEMGCMVLDCKSAFNALLSNLLSKNRNLKMFEYSPLPVNFDLKDLPETVKTTSLACYGPNHGTIRQVSGSTLGLTH